MTTITKITTTSTPMMAPVVPSPPLGRPLAELASVCRS